MHRAERARLAVHRVPREFTLEAGALVEGVSGQPLYLPADCSPVRRGGRSLFGGAGIVTVAGGIPPTR